MELEQPYEEKKPKFPFRPEVKYLAIFLLAIVSVPVITTVIFYFFFLPTWLTHSLEEFQNIKGTLVKYGTLSSQKGEELSVSNLSSSNNYTQRAVQLAQLDITGHILIKLIFPLIVAVVIFIFLTLGYWIPGVSRSTNAYIQKKLEEYVVDAKDETMGFLNIYQMALITVNGFIISILGGFLVSSGSKNFYFFLGFETIVVSLISSLSAYFSIISSSFFRNLKPEERSKVGITLDPYARQIFKIGLFSTMSLILLDCRINAWPNYTGFRGINRQSPNFIFIDLDLSHFGSRDALDRVLRKVLKNIKEKFNGAQPTVICSGNSYHIYLPIQAFILESESIFAEYEQPSKKFLRFSEKMLTNNKADPCHSNNLSFKNCMLRVPGSHNSECVKRNNNTLGPTTEVKIVQKWDGNRPAINWLLRDFRRYLIQEKIDKNVAKRKRSLPNTKNTSTKRLWIETLLDTPIEDYRKYAIRRIIAPYLINIRKLAYDNAFSITKNWLNNCDKVKPVDFNPNTKIKDALRAATRVGYLHIGFSDLKSENGELYKHISNRIGNSSSGGKVCHI